LTWLVAVNTVLALPRSLWFDVALQLPLRYKGL